MVGIVLTILSVLAYAIAQSATNLWEEEVKRQMAQQLDQSVEIVANFMSIRKTNLELWTAKLLESTGENYPGLTTFIYFSDIKGKEPWIEDIFLIKPGNVIYDNSGTLEINEDTSQAPKKLLDLLKQPLPDFFPIKLITSKVQPDKDVLVLKRQLTRKGALVEGHHMVLLLNLGKVNQWLFGESQIGKNGFLSLVAQSNSGNLFVPLQSQEGQERFDFW